MRIDLGSIAFNSHLDANGGTPSWSTALGQVKPDLKITVEGAKSLVIAMTHCFFPKENVYCPLGKGGKVYCGAETNEIQQAALFKKVYINDLPVPAPFILLITIETSDSWLGRKSFKYSPKITAKLDNGQTYDNAICYEAMEKALNINPKGCWFVYDLSVKNQDELHFSAIVVNDKEEEAYIDSKVRKTIWTTLIDSDTVRKELSKGIVNSSYQGDIAPIIYYGAPGTGKTTKAQRDILSKYDDSNKFFVTFHQSFSYEEFVEGLKPIMDDDADDVKYKIEEGLFKQACERAAKMAGYSSLADCIADNKDSRKVKIQQAIEEQKTVVLCIDELNRGNVASIFGDLISLIEPSKRLGAYDNYEMIATLPYSKKKFGVPANLFIVGTMNTADRSIQLLDSAIRRRFKFEELLPDYDVIENKEAKLILQGINNRIRCLLNKDSQIGHSYLMHAKTNKEILDALTNKIIPLLEEYFYNDFSQVRFVLNETKDNKYNFYKEDTDAKKAFETYQNFADIDAEDKSFYCLDESIKSVEDNDECAKYLEHLLPTIE